MKNRTSITAEKEDSMAIEEITLSAPGEPGQSGELPAALTDMDSEDARKLTQQYRRSVRARDRFTFTERARRRRHEVSLDCWQPGSDRPSASDRAD